MKTDSILDYEDLEFIHQAILSEQLYQKSFLITGGTGFIAKNIIRFLLYLNTQHHYQCHIYVICRNEQKSNDLFSNYSHEYLHFIIQDIRDKIILDKKVDYVFHCASPSSTRYFYTNPADIISTNMIGTYHILEFAKQYKPAGILFFSSGAVYGDLSQSHGLIKESSLIPQEPLITAHSYSMGKIGAESLCAAYHKQYDAAVKIVRIGHTYGPGIDLNDGHIYSDIVKSFIQKRNLVIQSNGAAFRAFCYITDAIIAFFKILIYGENGTAYNMANNKNAYSINELAHILTRDVFPERNLKVIHKTAPLSCKNKVYLDITKLSALGWQAQVDISEGFRKTVRSFEED